MTTDDLTPDDPRQARADAKAAAARAKALRPWYRKKRWWVLAAVVLVVGISAAGAGSGDDDDTAAGDDGPRTLSGNQENPPAADVEVSECGTGELGYLRAVVAVTNHSSKASNYVIEVAFESPDRARQLDSSPVVVNGLEPGQATTGETFTTTKPSGEFVCRVASVDRFAATGT